MNLDQTRRAWHSGNSGIAITEVLISVVVLLTISLGFYTGLSSCFGVVESSRQDLRATQIMVQKLETVRLCTWNQLTNFSFQESYDPLDVTNQQTGVVYYGTVGIDAATNISNTASYLPNICLVTVTVTWTNLNRGGSAGHTRQMQTQVARYGLQNYIWGAN